MATIVQSYGPIYGEVVNGTVQGRPNGSVYVPISNTITLNSNGATGVYLNSGVYFSNVGVGVVATSQDLASSIQYFLYSDAALTTQVGSAVGLAAGIFNYPNKAAISVGSDALTPGNTYYLVVKLINNSTPVAVSAAVELVAS